MKRSKLSIILVSLCTAFAIFLAPMTSIKANAIYEIVFKAGLHGAIDGGKSVSYQVQQGGLFPDEPLVEAQSGYVFKGWNKELPSVGSSVEGKQVYVAQYDVIVSGVNYIVRYVNEDNVEIATPKSSMGEEGTTISERAKTISGYTYTTAQKQFTLDKTNNAFVFTYTLTNPKEVIRYETEEITQVENGTNTNNQNNNANAGNQNNNNANEADNLPENDTPKGEGNDKEVISDDKTPKDDGKDSDNNYMMIAGIGAAIVIMAAIIIVYMKRKKATNA